MAWYRLEFLYADVLRVRHPAQSSFTHQGGEREQEVPAKSLRVSELERWIATRHA